MPYFREIKPGRKKNQLTAASQPWMARKRGQAYHNEGRPDLRRDQSNFFQNLRPEPQGYYNWYPKLGDKTGTPAFYGNQSMFALGNAGPRVDRLVNKAISTGDNERLLNFFTQLGRKQATRAVRESKQGGYLGDDQRTYLRDLGFHIAPFKAPESVAAARARQVGGIPQGASETTTGSSTDAIKAAAEAAGLPLTPEYEASMRQYEDQLSAQLASLGVAAEQIKPMVDLALERMATQQGIDTAALRESLVDRGIYDSGTTTRDWSRLNADYTRNRQDLAMNAAQQYADIASQQGEAYLNYQQQMIEALIQRALAAAQNVPLGLKQWGYEGVTGKRTRRRKKNRNKGGRNG